MLDFIFNLSKTQKILIVVGIFWGLSGEGLVISLISAVSDDYFGFRYGDEVWWAGLVAIVVGVFLAGDESQFESIVKQPVYPNFARTNDPKSIKKAPQDDESLWAAKKRKEREEKEDEDESGIWILIIIALISVPFLILYFV